MNIIEGEYEAIFNVQCVSQVKILHQKPCVLCILQEEYHRIDLLSNQIDKYDTYTIIKSLSAIAILETYLKKEANF